MDTLRAFYNDEQTRESVREFFLEQLDALALSKLYAGDDVNGIKDAREAIEKAFAELEEAYAKKKQSDTINQAR